jgi:trigger factor
VPVEAVSAARAEIVSDVIRKAKLPGFRPGKAPRQVIEKRFSKAIEDRLSQQLIDEGCKAGIGEKGMKVMSIDEVDETAFGDDGAFRFTAHLTTRPEFELPEYLGVPLRVPRVEVSDQAVDAVIERQRQQFAEYVKAEGRPASMGDVAVIDYRGTIGGQPFGEVLPDAVVTFARCNDYWMKLDEAAFLPGFCSALAGALPGEEREVTVTLPDDFPVPEGRGVEVVYSVTVKEVKEAKLPALDDAFAEMVQPGSTYAELRDSVRERIETDATEQVAELKRQMVLAHLSRQLDFEMPSGLLKQETQAEVDRLVERGQDAGLDDEEIMDKQQQIFASASSSAHQNVKAKFILAEIARREGIRVSDSELTDYLTAIATTTRLAPKAFAKRINDGNRLALIRERLLFSKVVDFLVEKATVEEVDLPDAPPSEQG